MTGMAMTTVMVILSVAIGIQTEDVPVDPYREIESDLGFVMNHGLISAASQRMVDDALEKLDDEWADENINEINTDILDDDLDENMDDDDDEEETHGRSITKRFLLNTPRKLWPKCVIPYTLDMTTLVPEKVSEILSAMSLFEYWTCFRFVPWTATTGQDFGLEHDNHLNFGRHSGCWSHVGMSSAGMSGQNISCCQGKNCIHEIGHALGFSHEQQNPYRDDYVRINYENIKPDNVFAFHKVKAHKRALFPWRYDYTSVMHYGLKAFNKNGRAAITLLDPHMKYLVGEKDSQYYYFLREAESVYKCTDDKCPDFTATCAYDGYLTYREGQCVCRCIAGLDSATNCTTIEGGDKARNIKWPEGGFSILKVKDVKCPKGSEVGYVTHFGQGKRSRDYDIAGSVSAKATKLEFCTFSSGTKKSKKSITWPPGQYCVSRAGGSCPEGFTNGFLQYADVRPPVTSGTLPDGNYTLHTKFEFCCRSDGNKDNPIVLPVKQPFLLWKRDRKACQKVKGAVGIPQHFEFTNRRARGVAELKRPLPLFKKRYRKMVLYVCIYKPIQKGCGGIIHLTESDSIRELTSPDYPASYRPLSVCTWVIQSPPNTTMLLSFPEFEIPASTEDPSVCSDKVEIRSFLPGQPGISYCGSGFRSAIESQTNIMSLILHSMTPQTGSNHFRASVSLAPQGDDLCYLSGDKGWTYRGDINFTHDLQTCLPWRNVTNCHHHEFAEGDRFAGLEGNKCRSPGHGTRPWCYTHAEDCRRDYCDVCGTGGCFDILDDCLASKTADFTYCLLGHHIKEGVVGCARTCGLCDTQKSAPASSIRCSSPTPPIDGKPLDALRASYRVGENVHFRCMNGGNIRSQTCLTDSTWAGEGRVCQVCPDDWRIMGDHCYKYFPDPVNETEAVRRCGNEKGQVAMAKTTYERDFIYNLLLTNPHDIWLGLGDKRSEGTLLWTDGTPLDHEQSGLHWNKGKVTNKRRKDCAKMNKSRNLVMRKCSAKEAYVCQTPIIFPSQCHDERDDCAELLDGLPTLCTDFRGFGVRSCAATCRECERSL
ncbi:uncharacterized protein LOC110447211 [Mizuhopecten yessoensis]|uniref:Metalloendopeptidase n=1 Tax=Mizuhopecten yessoensis TaxID=6573 RepID=A0A210QVZ4_MIZYE|nr:uncharacterized protein LOC110447211 [Mizuhopecten yessoensis]OWF52856.1 Blastula protease 10 [Mizuhopecten yessoensis]